MLRAVGFTGSRLPQAAGRRRLDLEQRSRPATCTSTSWRAAAAAGADARRRQEHASSTPSPSPTASRWARPACATRSCRARSSPTRSRRWSGAQGFDGLVAIGGCDKNMPGCVMAMARLEPPGGVRLRRHDPAGRRKRATSSRCSRPSARTRAGAISDAELREVERTAIPGPGSCGGMYTANTMASAIEALGMSLANSSAQEAVSRAQARRLPSARARRSST